MKQVKGARRITLTAMICIVMGVFLSGCVPSVISAADEEQQSYLLYQGHGSIRIVTKEGKVIYIDPYAGSGYDLPADLILVTHAHTDHNRIKKITSRNEGCRVITQAEALKDGEHQTFALEYARIQAVEAGYNPKHNVKECVGYVITLNDGISIYISGDTSTTEQMSELAEMKIDYAFFCCDGHFNMGPEEAAQCAKLVNAENNIPYHTKASRDDPDFDVQRAEEFESDNRLILEMGQQIALE